MKKEKLYSRKENLEDFYILFIFYGLVNMIIFVINFFSYDGYWWFLYPLYSSGFGIFIFIFYVLTMSKPRVEFRRMVIK